MSNGIEKMSDRITQMSNGIEKMSDRITEMSNGIEKMSSGIKRPEGRLDGDICFGSTP